MRAFMGVLASIAISSACFAEDSALHRCSTVPDAAARLRCFDTLAAERGKEPPAIGKIEICRAPGVVGTHQDDAIDIPTGASVVNTGEKSSLVAGSIGRVVLSTIEAVTLRHGSKCVTAQARIKENLKHREITASPTVQFQAQGDSSTPWATVASYRITVVSDFK